MSLVTRCPACATTFKVVRDQLRISDGWVRCGRCSEVFDATQALHDTDSGQAVDAQAFATPKAPPLEASPPLAAEAPEQRQPDPDSLPQQDKALAAPADAAPRPAPASGTPFVPQAMAWPASGVLDLPVSAAPEVPDASDVPGGSRAPGALFSLKQPARESAPAAEPAWRRIQIAQPQQSQPPAAPAPGGLLADEPWPMRHASASASAEPASDDAQVAASAIDAAVDAQLQKALRQARIQARRKERKQQALSRLDAAAATPAFAAERPAPAGVRQTVAQATAKAPAPVSKPPMRSVAAGAGGPSADTLLDSTLYGAEFMESRPSALDAVGRARGKPWVWGLLALLAVALLVLQWMRHERDGLAASQPALRPAIEALCRFSGCTLAAPRRIAAVRIDGSSFTPAREAGQFELLFTLRNADSAVVAMPSIELSLLDGNERAVMRRVFHPADFGAPAQLAPRAEQRAELRLLLQPPPEQRVSAVVGYSMLAFYP
ncbi:DUF3426 domain-containing protein [Xenophilus arseniciresistens]|uniref:DUF3426 domain-containing protein n=1 Tax=Xenophilus arseniciresistens TaxID=1283306 RepID=A0AAE3T1Z6_9BURK|nr:DUF3426 domain-containing protein [Xenophilus arseniciresistens]MDA7417907.1 DUF3426 domain-containing protein [Xenophilus arseniciresistens]